MCNYSDFVANRSHKEGLKKGKVEDLINLMKKLKLSIDQAMDALCIPESEWTHGYDYGAFQALADALTGS